MSKSHKNYAKIHGLSCMLYPHRFYRKFEPDPQRQISVQGLWNLRYSCFLNVIIQLIYHTPELHNLFSSNHRSPVVRMIHQVLMYMKGALMCLAA